jgi:predicted nucleotidyltransferase
MNLNSKQVQRTLPLLALRPQEGHTLTDLARFSGVGTKSVWQALRQFRADGALLDGAYGPKTYSINPDYELYPEIKIIAFRFLRLPEALIAAGARVDLVVLYGSVFRPVFRRQSDLDLLVVGRDETRTREVAAGMSERLGKRMNVTFYTPAKFVADWEAADSFLAAVFAGPHAVLTGSLDKLGLAVA